MEIVVRAAVVYLVLWLVVRAVGRTPVAELNTHQLVLVLMVGDLVQQGVTQQDQSVTGAVLAVCTVGLVSLALTWLSQRSATVRRVTHGVPVVVVHRGQPLLEVMRAERLSADDLLQQARQQGITDLADVRTAVLETDGEVSFLRDGTAGDEPPAGR